MDIKERNSNMHLTTHTLRYKLPHMNTTLAERLVRAMKERGMSQGALARATGVAQPTIWRLVKGESRGSTRLVDIARALSVSVTWLAHGTGSMDEAGNTDQHTPEVPVTPGVSAVPVFDGNNNQTSGCIYVPGTAGSRTQRAYVLERNSGCSEAPAGTVIVTDAAEKPGNGDLVYAQVNGSFSVYKFIEGGASGYLSVDDTRVPLVPVSEEARISGVIVFLLRDLKHKK